MKKPFVIAVFVILLLVTASYVVAIQIDAVALEKERQSLGPFAPDKFGTVWTENPLYITVGALILMSWILLIAASLDSRRKVAVAVILLLNLTLFGNTRPVLALDTIHYDVFVVSDEEFDSGRINVPLYGWMDSNEFAEVIAFPRVYRYFAEEFGFAIEFHWHHWASFDSDDSTTDMRVMLAEAKSELHWSWGKIVDGEPIELMLVLTQQEMNYQGWSPPSERVMVIWADSILIHVLIHELGHQFMLLHCSEDCVMNVAAITTHTFGVYCGHYDQLLRNRGFLSEPYPSRGVGGGPAYGEGINGVSIKLR